MKKVSFWFFLIIFSYISGAYAFISVTELIENAREHDFKEVCVKGETIGDIFYKKEFAWINVSDGSNAIGVWMPAELAKNMSHPGDYNHAGDFIQITGRFHRACPEHMGEVDIHLDALNVLKKGSNISRPVDKKRLKITSGVFIFAVILFGIEIFLRKKEKENEPEG
ncbi:MAG: DNA-binding protein [bacterium]